MSAHGRETPPAGYSDKDSAPLIPGKQGKLKESFATAKNGHHKEHNSPQRKTPVPKLAQLRKWMRVDFNGGLSYIAADKHTLVMELGIPYRDLRVLDPMVASSYPTAILIRERALVINLESVRMIVCQDQVLLQNVPAPQWGPAGVFPTPDSPFVQDLKTRLSHAGSGVGSERTLHMDVSLPFELVAVEAALSSCCKSLEQEAADLEHRAEPSLVRLSQKVSRKELENVKNYKATLNRLIVRVSKVKSVVEDILDDDQDMEDMNLGKRAENDQLLAADYPGDDPEAGAGHISRGRSTTPQELFDIIEGPLHSTAEDADLPAEDTAPKPALPLDVDDEALPSFTAGRTGRESQTGTLTHATSRRSASGQPLLPVGSPGSVATSSPTGQSDDGKEPELGEEAQLHRAEGRAHADAGHAKIARVMRQSTQPRLRIHKQASIPGEPISESYPPRLTRRTTEGDGIYFDGTKTVFWPRKAPLVDKRDIEATEDLLDSYFMQVDHTLSRLNVLKERIESVEALVTIDLDHRRNELVAFDLVLTMVTLSLTFMAMIASIFGQNLYFSGAETTVGDFLWATLSSIVVAVIMLIFLLAYARMKRLLFIPSPHSGGTESAF